VAVECQLATKLLLRDVSLKYIFDIAIAIFLPPLATRHKAESIKDVFPLKIHLQAIVGAFGQCVPVRVRLKKQVPAGLVVDISPSRLDCANAHRTSGKGFHRSVQVVIVLKFGDLKQYLINFL
jgi:hypothetical protein